MSIDSDGMFDDLAIEKAFDEGRHEDAHKLIAEGMSRAEAQLAADLEVAQLFKEAPPRQHWSIKDFLSGLFS